MQTLRRNIKLKEGEEVATLFTPHLFSFAPALGLKLEVDTSNLVEVLETYADVYYLAALNAWVLDNRGTVENFPHLRGDFHAYMASNPKAFAKDVEFAVVALTGKTPKELVAEQEKSENGGTPEPEEGKKKVFSWIGRRSRSSS